jgi:MerR family transcriptional regulator, light-induced transcriptional regulator
MNKPAGRPLGKYRIAAAARWAGVSPELLRAWERRYQLVRPSRTDGGYRVYSEDDVYVLRGARRLTETGLSIAEAAGLPRHRLREAGESPEPEGGRVGLAGLAKNAPQPGLVSSAGVVPPISAANPAHAESEPPWLVSALAATRGFDAAALERTVRRRAAQTAYTPIEICENVLLPLLKAIGVAWERGEISVAAEHFGSRIARARLTELIEIESRGGTDGPVAVCACPPGERHEGALLAFAVHAASVGFRVVYLGADTPVADILSVAAARDARLCAVSLTHPLSAKDLRELVRPLARWRRAGRQRRVVMGGRGVGPAADTLRALGVEVFDRVGAPLAEHRA